MKNLYILIIISSIMMAPGAVSTLYADIESSSFYEVTIHESLKDVLKKKDHAFGSGLSFKKHGRRKARVFYTVSDGVYQFNDTNESSASPLLATITVREDRAELDRVIPLVLAKGVQVPENARIDVEGVAIAPGNIVWLADEAGPSLLKVNSKLGTILAWISPGKGLPEWLSEAEDNRGFEGITRLEGGDIVAILQAPLADERDQHLYRLVRYTPDAHRSKTYGYQVPEERIATVDELKIGGLQALDGERLLVLEHGSNQLDQHCVYVNILDLADTGGSDTQREGRDAVTRVTASPAASLCDAGWKQKKVEGITLAGNGSEIALISDSDNETAVQMMILSLSSSLLPMRSGDIAILFVIFMVTVAMIGFVFAVVTQKSTSKGRS